MGWKLDKNEGVKQYFIDMKPHFKRFLTWNPIEWTHAYVNLFVEGCRISPYHHGHVVSYLFLVIIVLGIIL